VPAVECVPEFIAPMLLTPSEGLPDDAGWVHEVKWDGMRAQLRFDGRRVTVRSRYGRDCSEQFPEVHAIATMHTTPVLLDGELVCFDAEGCPDFEQLRSRLRCGTPSAVAGARAQSPATLVIFDVLHLAGKATRKLAYRERRAVLDELTLTGPAWRTPRVFAADEDLAAVTCKHHLEGVVAKRLSSAYQPGRRAGAWLKHKHRQRERLTVTAWRPGNGREPDEVLVARRDHDGELRYAGGVRFGLRAAERARLRGLLIDLERLRARRARVRWVRPLVEVDVDYHGRPGGPLRDPILRGITDRSGRLTRAAN